jgi:outer membrane protein OmpA-like peptidoglycan-associated protein
MSLKRTLLAATFISSVAGAASAQMPLPSLEPAPAFTGLYIGAGVGLNWLQNEHLINATGTASNASLSTHVGYATVASVGWAMPNGIRVELEGAFRNNQFSSAHDFGFSARAGGREFKYGPMVNVLYDMTNFLADYTGLRIPYFAPYVGVGVGWQWSQLKGFTASANGGGPNGFFPSVASNDTYSAIAYQFILGGAMPIRSVPGLALTTEYRFFGVGSRKYDVTTQATAVSPIAFGTAKLGNDFNHSLMIGLRYNFNQPPPPPPAQAATPAPAPARSYLVFFDWDKATLTDRARQIIAEAATNSTKVQYTRIEVNGYTDTSGTPKYNQGLSVRRAKAVEAELIKDGVPASAITIQGFGDTHLLVPTGPGVREPQNRRVEIIIK